MALTASILSCSVPLFFFLNSLAEDRVLTFVLSSDASLDSVPFLFTPFFRLVQVPIPATFSVVQVLFCDVQCGSKSFLRR